MNNPKVLLGEKIKCVRALRGLTQEQLAEIVDRSKNHISKIEQGLANPPLELLINISDALSVKLSDLFDFEGSRESNIDFKTELKKIVATASDKHLKLLYKIHTDLKSQNIL